MVDKTGFCKMRRLAGKNRNPVNAISCGRHFGIFWMIIHSIFFRRPSFRRVITP
jgi:hypothetical protein